MRVSVLSALVVASLSLSAPGSVVVGSFSDNFDSYADTAAYTASWPVVGSLPTGTISTLQSVSPPNSISISAPASATAQRNQKTFYESGTLAIGEKITFSFDFYDVDVSTVFRQYANLQDGASPGSTNQLISLGINNNQTTANSGGNYYMARILGYTNPTVDPDGGPNESVTGAGIYFKLNDFGVGLRSAGWHNLKVELTTDDGIATDYSFFVDNLLAEKVSNVGGAATLRSYDIIRLGAGVSSLSGATPKDAFYDNVYFASVPEASSFMAVGAVGMLFAAVRRFRRC